jgi:DnaK suppressor protein
MISREEIKKLNKQLLEEKAKIEAEMKKLKVFDMGDDTDHGEEEADETEEFLTNENISLVLKKRLENIDKALEKIDNGVYGYCEKCKKEILMGLLKIDPESRLCADCKRNEQKPR